MGILFTHANALELKHHTVLWTIETGKQWMIDSGDGLYVCTSETTCDGFGNSETVISGRPLWADPLLVFHVKDDVHTRCRLKACVKPRPLTYNDLKWGHR